MEGNDEPASHVIAQLVQMGFEISLVIEAIEAVGPSLEAAIDFLVDDANRKDTSSSGAANGSTNNASILGKRAASSHPPRKMKQSSILDHMNLCISKRLKTGAASVASISASQMVMPLEKMKESCVARECDPRLQMKPSEDSGFSSQDQEIGLGFEQNISCLLQKHFGFSTLKSFQKEALKAWLGNQDCLVLAATGSGKSLCFQIPALLTGKVVVVISPLISLMRDQCLKLAKHGVSACFLGSGQTDSSVEHKAMNGMYNIIYVCPETVLRLIEPLQKVAENYGIALFAIDEVHCVSKWGHDFRSDYRRLSVLRENFSACKLKFLRSDIPLMALTATATVRVREDIIDSLCMSKYTKIVITSFFRPNLRFSVKHSITSSPSSYEKDFDELIDSYTKNRVIHEKELCPIPHGSDDVYDSYVSSESSDEDNFDVVYDEFCGSPIESSTDNEDICGPSKRVILPVKLEERMTPQGPPEQGPTIIYVPTRKETLALAKYLSQCGIRAAPYNAKLPEAHLRRVHSEFHQNMLEVVVATIAFGMGIDKSNVRKIIHYGWPQSLEAYYQEAGRAGRDGKLADCILFANLSRIPTLLPSRRSEEQTKVAYKMLSDCFRYGMDTTSCRAKTLVEYFGEDFADRKCLMCDVCVGGPPEIQNLKEEADIFMRVVASLRHFSEGGFCDDVIYGAKQMPNFRMIVSKIREQFPKFAACDRLWWQGLARILEDKGYLREGNNMTQVCIKFPELTELGVRFLQSEVEETLYVHPQADMLLSMKKQKSFSTFSDWGKGWADPKIRQQRLQGRKHRRKKRPRRHKQDLKTVRGRLAAKLSKPRR